MLQQRLKTVDTDQELAKRVEEVEGKKGGGREEELWRAWTVKVVWGEQNHSGFWVWPFFRGLFNLKFWKNPPPPGNTGSENGVKEREEGERGRVGVGGAGKLRPHTSISRLEGASVRPVCMWSAVCVQVYPHNYYTTISHGIWWQGLKSVSLSLSGFVSHSLVQLRGPFRKGRTPKFLHFPISPYPSVLSMKRSLSGATHTHTLRVRHTQTGLQGILCQNSSRVVWSASVSVQTYLS